MNFAEGLFLPGKLENTAPPRSCGRCGAVAKPYDGVQLSPTRWVCGACWRLSSSGKPKRSRKAIP